MTCSDFVEGFSEYYDGTASRAVIQAADEHLASCAECRRYMHVIERGLELLHALPAPEVRDDFVPRLQHRIYHVDQERSLRWHTSSGTTALAMAGMAILLTAVAWSPVLRSSAPTVELEPIVVSRPPAPYRSRPRMVFPTALQATPRARAGSSDGLWDDAHALLFEYSRLSQRYSGHSSLQRAGLEQDR